MSREIGIKKRFFSALYNSISEENRKNFKIKDDEKAYYDEKYRDKIDEEFKKRQVKSLECYKNRYGYYPICSLASSARLAFLDFRDGNEPGFEKSIKNDINSHTKIDVVVNNIYYECKCQEVLHSEYARLNIRYYTESELFKELVLGKDWDPSVQYPISIEKGYVDFKMSLLDDNIAEAYTDKEYYKLHFNVKQFICHLIAIASNSDGNESVLKYIIYRPKEEFIEGNLKRTYETLENEIEMVKNCEKIKDFCDKNRYNIRIENEFKCIANLKDTIYADAY